MSENTSELQMFDYTIYRLDTGEILSSGTGFGAGIEGLSLPVGLGVISGRAPVQGFYVGQGGVLAIPAKVDENTEWDWATKAYVPLPSSRGQIAQQIAEQRWKREVSGTTWREVPVNTTREARSMVSDTLKVGDTLGRWPAEWKFADEVFHPMNGSSDFYSLAEALFSHVQAAFAWEKSELARLQNTADSDLNSFKISAIQ